MLLVALLVWVLQSLVLGLGLGVVGCWVLLGLGPCHSWLRGWWVALLVGLPVCPSGVSDTHFTSPGGGPGVPFPVVPLWVPRHSWLRVVGFFGVSRVVCVCGAGAAHAFVCLVCLWRLCSWRLWWCVLLARGRLCGVLVVLGVPALASLDLCGRLCVGVGVVCCGPSPGPAWGVVVLRALLPLSLGWAALRAAPLVSCPGLPGLCGGVGWVGGGP